jgi:hypothetical protein
MNALSVEVPDAFAPSGRGPTLQHWLVDSDLLFDDSQTGFAPPCKSITGAQVETGWVVFHGLQVIQIVPEEVHSYWHLEPNRSPQLLSNVWRIENSVWLASFSQRHLGCHQHFIVTFYDELVEVICRDLLFGIGVFDLERAINNFPQLSYAYLRRAMSREKQGKRLEATSDYERYIAISPDTSSVEYARRCLKSLGQR